MHSMSNDWQLKLNKRMWQRAGLCFTFAAGAAEAGAAAACDDDDDEEGGVPAAVHSDRHETWIII